MKQIFIFLTLIILSVSSFAQSHSEIESLCQKAMEAVNNDDFVVAKRYYENAISIITNNSYPGLVLAIPSELSEYIITNQAKTNPEAAVKHAMTLRNLQLRSLRFGLDSNLISIEEYLDYSSNAQINIGKLLADLGMLESAEQLFQAATDIYIQNEIYTKHYPCTLELLGRYYGDYEYDYQKEMNYRFNAFMSAAELCGIDAELSAQIYERMVLSYYVYITYSGSPYHRYQSYEDIMLLINQWDKYQQQILNTYGADKYNLSFMKSHLFDFSGIYVGSDNFNLYLKILVAIEYRRLDDFNTYFQEFLDKFPEEYVYNYSIILSNYMHKIGINHILNMFEAIKRKFLNNQDLQNKINVLITDTLLEYGQVDEALEYYNEKNYAADRYIKGILTLSSIHADKEEYERELEILENLLADYNSGNISIPKDVLSDLYNSISVAYSHNKQIDKAIEASKLSIRLHKEFFSDNRVDSFLCNVYNNLAGYYIQNDDYQNAMLLLQECIKYYSKEDTYNTRGSYLSILINIIECLVQLGDSKQLDYSRELYEYCIRYYFTNALTMTKIQRAKFDNVTPLLIQVYSRLATLNKELTTFAYDAALLEKNITLKIDNLIGEHISTYTNNPHLLDLYNKYKEAILYNRDELVLLEEKMMYYMSKEEVKYESVLLNWQMVQDNLKNTDLAIEFVGYWRENSYYYAALLLKKGWNSPKMIELCDISELKKILGDGSRLYKANGTAYSCIWKKLEPYFKKGDNIYFAPHGLMHQLNIEVLCGADGKPMNKKCNLYRVSSTGNLVDQRESLKYTSATLYGGLNYDTDTTSLLAINRNYVTTPSYQRDRLLDESVEARAGWKSLPRTAAEVRNVGDILNENEVTATTYTGMVGTEESFKALSGNSTHIIHIATHGFYLEDNKARKEHLFELDYSDNVQTISPLKRSGLMFSGGQHAWLGKEIPKGIDDGVLTAEEIAGMNLTGTDLLVLSACQTGLGEITYEGVEGLQRGFKMAGVNTIIMSLWEVSDLTTETMMTTFYRSLINGNSKRDAFDLAINKVREKTIKMEKSGELRKLHPQDPHLWIAEGHWAAFIMLD